MNIMVAWGEQNAAHPHVSHSVKPDRKHIRFRIIQEDVTILVDADPFEIDVEHSFQSLEDYIQYVYMVSYLGCLLVQQERKTILNNIQLAGHDREHAYVLLTYLYDLYHKRIPNALFEHFGLSPFRPKLTGDQVGVLNTDAFPEDTKPTGNLLLKTVSSCIRPAYIVRPETECLFYEVLQMVLPKLAEYHLTNYVRKELFHSNTREDDVAMAPSHGHSLIDMFDEYMSDESDIDYDAGLLCSYISAQDAEGHRKPQPYAYLYANMAPDPIAFFNKKLSELMVTKPEYNEIPLGNSSDAVGPPPTAIPGNVASQDGPTALKHRKKVKEEILYWLSHLDTG